MEKNKEWLQRRLLAQHSRINSVMFSLGQDDSQPLESAVASLDARELSGLTAALRELKQITRDIEQLVSTARRGNTLSLVPRQNPDAGPQPQLRSVDVDEMALSVMQLVEIFEASSAYDSQRSSDWISPGGHTTIVRNGQSAFPGRTLQQKSDAVFAEYVVLHKGVEVFTFKDYVWPEQMQSDSTLSVCQVPAGCFDELVDFHRQHKTFWYAQYQKRHAADKINMNSAARAANQASLAMTVEASSLAPRLMKLT